MATVKLIIRENRINSYGLCVIYVKYTHNQNYILFSTGEKISPEFWDAQKQKVRKSLYGFNALNEAIQVKAEEIKEISRIAKQNRLDPTIEHVKSIYNSKKPNLPDVNIDFFFLFEKYTQDTASSKAHGTNKHYKSSLNHLREFATSKKVKVSLENMNLEFYDNFIQFLTIDKKMSGGSVNNQLKRLKVFLGYLYERGIHNDLTFKKFKRVKQNESDIVYLTQNELDTLYTFNLVGNKRLEKVRDLFILACTTGLRHSDFTALKSEHIKEKHISLSTQKTKDPLIIPLNNYSKAILKRYNNNPPKLSQQKFNNYIKELGQLCGIDEPTEVIRYNGSTRIKNLTPKYELLTSHTGRRTFITLSLEKGMRAETVMKISGHKDTKTLMRYVKITDKIKEVEMSKAWDSV